MWKHLYIKKQAWQPKKRQTLPGLAFDWMETVTQFGAGLIWDEVSHQGSSVLELEMVFRNKGVQDFLYWLPLIMREGIEQNPNKNKHNKEE